MPKIAEKAIAPNEKRDIPQVPLRIFEREWNGRIWKVIVLRSAYSKANLASRGLWGSPHLRSSFARARGMPFD